MQQPIPHAAPPPGFEPILSEDEAQRERPEALTFEAHVRGVIRSSAAAWLAAAPSDGEALGRIPRAVTDFGHRNDALHGRAPAWSKTRRAQTTTTSTRLARWAGIALLRHDAADVRILCVFVNKRGFWELPKGGVREREGDGRQLEKLAAQHWLLAETGVWAPPLADAPRLRQGLGVWFAALTPPPGCGAGRVDDHCASLVGGHRAAWLRAEEAAKVLRADHRAVLTWALLCIATPPI